MLETLIIRQASSADIPEILRQRRRMYEDMGHQDTVTLGAMISTCEPFLAKAVPEGMLRGWLGEVDGKVVAGGAVLLSPWPSHTYDGECRRATILNVYTDPEYRRQGIARKLMETMIEWCRSQGLAMVYLHASKDGRALYEELGFEPTTEMKLKLKLK